MSSMSTEMMEKFRGVAEGRYTVSRDELVELIAKYRAAGGGEYPGGDFDVNDYVDRHQDNPVDVNGYPIVDVAGPCDAYEAAGADLSRAIVAYCRSKGDDRLAESYWLPPDPTAEAVIFDGVMYQARGNGDGDADAEAAANVTPWVVTTVLGKVHNLDDRPS